MKISELIYNYPDLEDYLKLFEDSKDYILTSTGENANIHIRSCGLNLELSNNDLALLSTGEKIAKTGYLHLNHCGFTYKNYGEISIIVVPSKYAYTKEAQEWHANPLKFKINNKLFEVGSASSLFVLLNEPIYRDSDWQNGFQSFTTIKIINTNNKEIKIDTIKALFYLNSHYLKNIGLIAKIHQMKINLDEELDLWSDEYFDRFKKINRVRIRTRNDFSSVEPLLLYNQAQIFDNDEKFLYLYRILEFSMNRARIQKVAEARLDSNFTDNDLIKIIENKNEEKLLSNLLNEALNSNQKKRMAGYAFNRKLINEDNYKLLTNALYKYRNSIVHAKEQQNTEIRIPDPFEQIEEINPWIKVVDELALKCIIKYNKPSG